MVDSLWVLKHPTNNLTKTWKSDGTIDDYDDPKQFIGKSVAVNNIRELSEKLTKLETMPKACVIRGKYKGHDHSKSVEPTDTQDGKVLRRKSVHEDVPHHWMMVDVDGYVPFDYDWMLETEESIEEFITTSLPTCFHGVSYHWQLSSSAGHKSKDTSKLKVHLWFWLKTPYMSCQLRQWAKKTDYKADKALFDTIQVHYTATPVMEDGVINPISRRSGFVEGEFGDEVSLVIDETTLTEAGDGSAPASRYQKVAALHSEDPIVALLNEKGLVKSPRPDGSLNIICPRESEHSAKGGAESATIYYPAHTGGHVNGTFVCLHDHCREVPQGAFLDALGYVDDAGVFDDLDALDDKKSIPEPQHLTTDQANANRIVKKFSGRMVCIGGVWHCYDGKSWKADAGEATIKAMNLSALIRVEIEGYQKQLRREILSSARKDMPTEKVVDAVKGLAKHADTLSKSDQRILRLAGVIDQLEKWSVRSEMAPAINAALGLVKTALDLPSDKINSDIWLLNCQNGTLDLRTGKLKPHDPNDYITIITPCDYNPKAECPTFTETLHKAMREYNCPETPVSDYLVRSWGYSLTGSTREPALTILWGSGSNGKSTLIGAVAKVMAGYSGTAATEALMEQKNSQHPCALAHFHGKRMVTAHETGEGGVLREDLIKQMTGGDEITARYMYGNFFTFDPTHKPWLITNHKPMIKGNDHGIWRRVRLVPFLARFGSQDDIDAGTAHFLKDSTIPERIATEYEGILALLVRGCAEWYENDLCPPEVVTVAVKEYQDEQDRVGAFIDECCEVGDEHECYLTNGEHDGLYPAYMQWCKESGIRALSKVKLLADLKAKFQKMETKEVKVKVAGSDRRRKVLLLSGIGCTNYYEM